MYVLLCFPNTALTQDSKGRIANPETQEKTAGTNSEVLACPRNVPYTNHAGSRMRRAITVHTRGHWPEEAAVDSVTLAMIDRHRRRIRLVADSGAPFLLDLARAQHLTEGEI